MSEREDEAPRREGIEDLLPWYAAGTLDRRDSKRVESALRSDPILAERYAMVQEELAETIRLNEALGAPSTRVADRLFEAIEAEESETPRRARTSFGLSAWLGRRLARLSPPTLAWSAVAAALVLMLQGALITGLLLGQASVPGTFQTASGPGAGPPRERLGGVPLAGSFLLVGFAPGATAAAITDFLQSRNLAIVDGPRPGGLYRLRVADRPLPREELDRLAEAIRAEAGLVRFAAPAP